MCQSHITPITFHEKHINMLRFNTYHNSLYTFCGLRNIHLHLIKVSNVSIKSLLIALTKQKRNMKRHQ